MNAQGLIRKISVGDMKTGITYVVGQEMIRGTIIVLGIKLDVDTTTETGMIKYDIVVNKKGSPHARIWKSIMGMPVTVEYELDPEEDVSSEE